MASLSSFCGSSTSFRAAAGIRQRQQVRCAEEEGDLPACGLCVKNAVLRGPHSTSRRAIYTCTIIIKPLRLLRASRTACRRGYLFGALCARRAPHSSLLPLHAYAAAAVAAFSTKPLSLNPKPKNPNQTAARGVTGSQMRKQGIHPEWYPEAKVFCNGVEVMTVGGTKESYNVDIYSGNHPFYTQVRCWRVGGGFAC
jgi:ribosomal protein L31